MLVNLQRKQPYKIITSFINTFPKVNKTPNYKRQMLCAVKEWIINLRN